MVSGGEVVALALGVPGDAAVMGCTGGVAGTAPPGWLVPERVRWAQEPTFLLKLIVVTKIKID